MELRLTFEGDLRPRKASSLADIHGVRMALHPQLAAIWDHEPFCHLHEWLEPRKRNGPSARVDVDGQEFVAAINDFTLLHAELDVLVLRPQSPGMLISETGDIDNRIKTLFDALRVPTKGEVRNLRNEGMLTESRIHCLLGDDRLITRLSVSTDRWLGKSAAEKTSLVIIRVRIHATRVTMENLAVIS